MKCGVTKQQREQLIAWFNFQMNQLEKSKETALKSAYSVIVIFIE